MVSSAEALAKAGFMVRGFVVSSAEALAKAGFMFGRNRS
jgi:hypothetical protein